MGYVRALRDRGIKVIELQHGIISKKHHAYNVYKAFDPKFYPNYLLTFGKLERQVFGPENHYIPQDSVIPVGHFYLDHIKKNGKSSQQVEAYRAEYSKIVAIAAQDALEEPLIDFMKSVCRLSPKDLFVYMPRSKPATYYERYQFPKNLVFVPELNAYEMISLADFHSTITSTTALEAPALGVQNILIDLAGRSREFLGDILTNKEISRFVETPEEFVEALSNFQVLDPERIKIEAEEIILADYESNLQKVLPRILEHGS